MGSGLRINKNSTKIFSIVCYRQETSSYQKSLIVKRKKKKATKPQKHPKITNNL